MRYKPNIREQVDRAIHDATLANLTELSTLDYVKEKTGVAIARNQLYERRRFLKQRRIRMWNAYRNNDYAYRLEHIERISEAKLVKNIAIEHILKYRGDEKKYFQLLKSSYLLLEANKRIDELTQMIPEIDVIGKVDNSEEYGEVEQGFSSISTEKTNKEPVF